MNWDEDDVARRLCRALDITLRSLTLFSEKGYADAEQADNGFRPDKPIAEAAMLLYASAGLDHYVGVAERTENLALALVPLARSRRIMLSMSLHPSVCVEFAVPHILLSRLGYEDERFDEFLGLCLSSQAAMGHERTPFASLERRWILGLWSGAEPGRDWEADLQQSVLNWPIDILGGLKEDAYAFTHLAIYCTDFGFHVRDLPRPRSAILAEARSLLARCLDEEDYDLAAEILMIWPQLGEPWCAASAFGFRVLMAVEDQVGVLPSIRTKTERLNLLEGEERTRYAFATAYHTTLVMGLLCAVSLQDEKTPPVALSGRIFDSVLVEEIQTFIDENQGHWQPVHSALAESERSTLAPFLLDLALIQKLRLRDYDATNRLLEIAKGAGMDPSPLSVQASETLDRLVAFSSTVATSP